MSVRKSRYYRLFRQIFFYSSQFLPGRRTVAVLLEPNASPLVRQIVHRAAITFSGTAGIRFKVLSRHFTPMEMRALYFRFGGLLLTGGYQHATSLFPTRLLPIFNIDPAKEPMAAWGWHFVLSVLVPFTPLRLEQSKNRFTGLIHQLSNMGLCKCYVFGTGPSLEKAVSMDFTDGYRIACNTICKDRDLFLKLKPHILVAGDAQYHFGDTKHSQAFLRDLEKRMEEGDFMFCYPALFDPFVRRRFAQFEERLIPIPSGRPFELTTDMTRWFALPDTGNVLGLLLLPIGCQLSKDIWLLGFDGRRPSDKHFWANSAKHSYPELVEEMTVEYPAFYQHFVPKDKPLSYVTSWHGDALDAAMTQAEKAGWKFTLLSPSTSPALAQRRVAQCS